MQAPHIPHPHRWTGWVAVAALVYCTAIITFALHVTAL